MRRNPILILILAAVAGTSGCRHNKSVNPIANLDSKQPDKVLFDRSMDAIKRNRFDEARITLQTLINTYPDSEFIARAKLAIADSWYFEGGSAGYAQAESEYKDFITFFPNLPEAAEAQLKVAGIHYRQMEKPDRDYTHAKRAEDEYRQLLLQFPDSKLVPEAKQHLLEVQEVLAEREFRIGRFYFLRESYPAAVARLKTLADSYPLYSNADETLYLLGQSYEAEMELVRHGTFSEAQRANLLHDLANKAASVYGRIVTRYPAMERAEAARERLKALDQPVPEPTPDALAQNKAEAESRRQTGRMGQVMGALRSRPDVSQAVRVGEPTLQDPKQTSAIEVVKDFTNVAGGSAPGKDGSTATIQTGTAKPTENQPPPRSDNNPATPAAVPGLESLAPVENPGHTTVPTTNTQPAAGGVPATGEQIKPPAPAEAPARVNEIKPEDRAPAAGAAATTPAAEKLDKAKESSSKKKHQKKKAEKKDEKKDEAPK